MQPRSAGELLMPSPPGRSATTAPPMKAAHRKGALENPEQLIGEAQRLGDDVGRAHVEEGGPEQVDERCRDDDAPHHGTRAQETQGLREVVSDRGEGPRRALGRLVGHPHEREHQNARRHEARRRDHHDGRQPKEPEDEPAEHRPSDAREHAHLVGHRDGLLQALGRHHARNRGLHAGLVDGLRREGDHQHGGGEGDELRGPGERQVAEKRHGECEVARRHHGALARAVGDHAADGREQQVRHVAERDDRPVERARSREVEQVERNHELQDLHPQQREDLGDHDGHEPRREEARTPPARRLRHQLPL